jgi:CHAT domain-containing protein
LFKEVYNDQLPFAVNNLQYYAECLIELNRLPEAEKMLQEAQRLAQQTGDRFYVTASLWSAQGKLLRLQGKFEASIQAYQRSIQANSTQWTATDLYALPVAVIEQRDFLWETQLWLSLLGLAEAWEEYHRQSQDPRHLEQAYALVELHTRLIWQSKNELKEPSDQRQLLATARQVFERGIELAWKMQQEKNELKYLLQAFQWAESNKSIFLLQALRQQQAQAQDLLPTELLEEQRRLEQNIQKLHFQKREATHSQAQSQLNQALQQAQSDYARWLQKIQRDYPSYYAFHFGLQPQPVANIQQRLQQGELLLTYFVGQKETFLFALSPNKWTAHRLKPDWQQAKRLRQTLANPQLDSFPSQYPVDAHALYQNLVQPALAAHAAPKTLIIVPDGLLNDLPFEVFLTEATSKGQWAKLPYLLRQYNVRYQYAAQLYSRSGGGFSVKNGILGMAASYADQPLERLPARRRFLRKGLQELKGAKDEVQNLQKTFGGGSYFLGEKATEAQFKDIAGEFDILHLALHGLMNEDHPMASALAFTENGDTLEDNLLHAYEIMHLPLKAQLVVLSACETGYGKFDQGEGVMSLARSFFHAGAQSLVVSLWSVNDLTTQLLMQNFYGHLRKGLAKDEALRQAKLDYLDQVNEDLAAHPGLWAAFIALGDPAPLVWERPSSGGAWLLALGLLALVPLVWLVQRWV